jgi:cell division transport system permease protein
MAKSKTNTKALAQSKRHRRTWLTFWRMVKYGVANFSRNTWLTIAATAVMTITLLIIFVTVVSRQVLVDSVTDLQRKVDMSIYLKGDTPDAQANRIADSLRGLSNVEQVTYISSTQARSDFAEQNKSDPKLLEALNNATNKFFGTLRIGLKNINDTTQLDEFVKTDVTVKKYMDPDRAPSFAGTRRSAIKNLASSIDFAQKIGIGASILFVAISSLIVFNTIRMAIFNRRDEIEMMKLIGANKGFIRGPFVVEAMVYGIVAGVLAMLLGMVALELAKPGLISAGVAVQPTIDFMTTYVPFVTVGMVLLGALVGAVSSLLATRRYLKI